jgi:alginate O-acetyltransferase complex protein AlgI
LALRTPITTVMGSAAGAMLFNSYLFIFGFMPVALIGFFLASSKRRSLGAAWLVLMSLLFYAYWRPPDVIVLVASIAFNYSAGYFLARIVGDGVGKLILGVAVGTNLAALLHYKYMAFLLTSFDAATGLDWTIGQVVLPLGISFFTFTQIAYLVDVYRGKAKEANPLHYALFVTYFPHLIAGPIPVTAR